MLRLIAAIVVSVGLLKTLDKVTVMRDESGCFISSPWYDTGPPSYDPPQIYVFPQLPAVSSKKEGCDPAQWTPHELYCI